MALHPDRNVKESAAATAVASPPQPEVDTPGWKISAWDLGELLPDADEPTVAARLSEIEALVDELVAARGELSVDMDRSRFLELLVHFETLLEKLDVVAGYASLWFSANTQSSAAVAFRNRIQPGPDPAAQPRSSSSSCGGRTWRTTRPSG